MTNVYKCRGLKFRLSGKRKAFFLLCLQRKNSAKADVESESMGVMFHSIKKSSSQSATLSTYDQRLKLLDAASFRANPAKKNIQKNPPPTDQWTNDDKGAPFTTPTSRNNNQGISTSCHPSLHDKLPSHPTRPNSDNHIDQLPNQHMMREAALIKAYSKLRVHTPTKERAGVKLYTNFQAS